MIGRRHVDGRLSEPQPQVPRAAASGVAAIPRGRNRHARAVRSRRKCLRPGSSESCASWQRLANIRPQGRHHTSTNLISRRPAEVLTEDSEMTEGEATGDSEQGLLASDTLSGTDRM
jgi:hypothetical protein